MPQNMPFVIYTLCGSHNPHNWTLVNVYDANSFLFIRTCIDFINFYLKDLNNWAIGWVDWNIALDTVGGPNYIKNNVDAPILINASADEFYKQPMYYAMGHFSKFVVEGSVRINSRSSLEDLSVIAFRRPDGGKVVVILNK